MYDALSGREFLLIQLPGGLMSLHHSLGEGFHYVSAHYALEEFKRLTGKLARSPNDESYGKRYELLIPGFEKTVSAFAQSLIQCELSIRFDFESFIEPGVKRKFREVLRRRLRRQPPRRRPEKKSLPVSEAEFLRLARQMMDQLFLGNGACMDRPVLLNQAGSGWNPIKSTQYFSERKVITVIRDPRDNFAELKQYKEASGVKDFVIWYRAMQDRLDESTRSGSSVNLIVWFERFISEFDDQVNRICNHIGIESSLESNFIPDLSKPNIGKYKKLLSSKEIRFIESELGEYIRS